MENQSYNIAYIAAGAAGMYCGSCIRDNALVTALQELGQDAYLIPTYTPLRTDEPSIAIDKVFYNGLRVFLEQKIPALRAGKNYLDRIFGSSLMLNMLSRSRASTDAKELGELTISVLQGEGGNQERELNQLVTWLKDELRPEIVQLTNSMFAGMAREIKKSLQVPVICNLQGEDIFLEELDEPYKSRAKAILQERAQDVDAFIATSDYYAEFMATYLDVHPNKIHVARLGINVSDLSRESLPARNETFALGYLARICPEKGLHLLIKAFDTLATQRPDADVKLRIAGYLGKRDHAYFKNVKKMVKDLGLSGRVEFCGELERDEKIAFLHSLDSLCVPTVYHEPKGLFALEAMTAGVPALLPAHGAFPEILAQTEGGLTFAPNSPEDIAAAILRVYDDEELRKQLATNGAQKTPERFDARQMARQNLDVVKRLLSPTIHTSP